MLSFHSVLRIVKFLKRDVGVFFSTDDDVLAAGCHGAVSHWLQWSFGDAFNPLKKGLHHANVIAHTKHCRVVSCEMQVAPGGWRLRAQKLDKWTI